MLCNGFIGIKTEIRSYENAHELGGGDILGVCDIEALVVDHH